MTTIAIVQARMTSSRLPGKVLEPVAGTPVLAYLLRRLQLARSLDTIVVATTLNAADDPVAELAAELGAGIFRGDEHDVLGRFAGAAKQTSADTIVRLTADCPMLDPWLLDEAITKYRETGVDYLSNVQRRTFPNGLDFEIFAAAALLEADKKARDPFQREHVTPYLRTGSFPAEKTGRFRIGDFEAPANFAHLRWTIDTADDLRRVRAILDRLPPDHHWMDALALVYSHEDLAADRPPIDPVAVSLRPAQEFDSRLLYSWVNRPDSLAGKLQTTAPVPWPAHENWVTASLRDPHCAIWIAEANRAPIGQVRIDARGTDQHVGEVDIFVIDWARQKGVGMAILDRACQETAQALPDVHTLRARIRPDNLASEALFRKAGYAQTAVEADTHLIFDRPVA